MKQFDFEVRRPMGGGKDHFAKGDVRTMTAADALVLVQHGALAPKGKDAQAAIDKLIGEKPQPQPIVQPVPAAEVKAKDAGNAPNNKADVGAPQPGSEGEGESPEEGKQDEGGEAGAPAPASTAASAKAKASTAKPATAAAQLKRR